MASQFIDEFKATYAERFSDASFLRPLELWAFYRFVRRVHRHMGELDARLEQLAKERDDALLQLGQQMLGRHNENSITGSYRFEQTLQNIDDQRAQLLETVQTLEHQITQLRSRTAALIREKDNQLIPHGSKGSQTGHKHTGEEENQVFHKDGKSCKDRAP